MDFRAHLVKRRSLKGAVPLHRVKIQNVSPGSCLQYSAGNVDHNVRSIDGTGTFHAIGIIAMVPPGTTLSRTIPRVNVTADDIAHVVRKNIHHFLSERESLQSICYQPIRKSEWNRSFLKFLISWSQGKLCEIHLSCDNWRTIWARTSIFHMLVILN